MLSIEGVIIEDKYLNLKVLKVEDIKDIIGIGYNAAYSLVKNHQQYGFTVHKIGRQFLIPKDKFFEVFDLK